MRLRTALAAGAATAAIAPVALAGLAPAPAQAAAEPSPHPSPSRPASASASASPSRSSSGSSGSASSRHAASASASPAAPGGVPVDELPSCGDVGAAEFPVAARIVEGPAQYRAGAGAHEFSVELTNTTAEPCLNIHPVLVLTGQGRALTPDRIRMEFLDTGVQIWRPVTIEKTEQGEAVGAFGAGAGGFAGLSLPARGIFTVRVRLGFPDRATAPDAVVANAAVVQRRGADGDWVGESNDYRFSILAAEPTGPATQPDSPPDGNSETQSTGASANPSGNASGDVSGTEDTGTTWQNGHELAATGAGPRYAIGLAAAGGALLAGSLVLLFGRRRLRSRPR